MEKERKAGLWSTGETPHPVQAPGPGTAEGAHAGEGDQVRAQAPPFTGRALELQQDLPTILGGASRGHHRCTPGCWGQGTPPPCSFPARPALQGEAGFGQIRTSHHPSQPQQGSAGPRHVLYEHCIDLGFRRCFITSLKPDLFQQPMIFNSLIGFFKF